MGIGSFGVFTKLEEKEKKKKKKRRRSGSLGGDQGLCVGSPFEVRVLYTPKF